MWTFVLVVIILLTVSISSAEAHHNLGIRLSDTCLTLIKLNTSQTDCPTYEEILMIYPDTSRKDLSGNFTMIDGILQREPPQLTKHFEFYRNNPDEHLFIDPPINRTFHMDMIVIETQIPTYKIKGSHVVTNGTVTFGHTRMVDDKCQNASIGSDAWLLYLGDTINYMKNDCQPEYTHVDTFKEWALESTEIGDKMLFKFYQMEKWLRDMAESCLTRWCI